MNLISFPDHRPYGAAAFLFIAAILVFLAAGTVVTIMELAPWSLYIIAFTLLAVICAALISIKGWWREVGFRAPHQRRMLWLFWLPFVPVIGNLIDGVPETDLAQVLLFFVMALLSGFVEETLFRGLILRALLPTGVWRAAVISALLFGGMHILNVLSISSPAAVLLQVGYAAAIGFGYAALVIRTGTIWPLILAHFLTNFAGFMAAGGAGNAGPVAVREMVVTAVYIAIFSAYGVYLLRAKDLLLIWRPNETPN
jgi:membrane protease YdiL (CAAX protease family)